MEFEILGALTVRSDAGAVGLGGARPRALLTMLLLHPNQPVTADRLAVALLGEDAPSSAIKTVRVHVFRLRKALGDPEVLATTPAGYRLRVRPDELDADRFERLAAEGRAGLAAGQPQRAAAILREALALWRGPPFADIDHLPFVAAEIARLEEARLAALEARVEADVAAGRHAEVVGELMQLCSAHPQRERLHELLMLAFYRSGRQAEALDAYRRARESLVAELGLEPGPGLRELERAILLQDPQLDLPAPSGPAAAPTAGAFVGRAREFGALLDGLDDAFAGRGRLYLVAGEPGIGKSRLAEELGVQAAARGASVLVGRCWEAGGAPAYWPWVQSLRAYIAAADTGSLRVQLAAGAAELAQLVPDLRRRFPGLPQPASLDSDGARFRLFEAIGEFLRNASAARPIVLVIDDLHAADAPSLLLLRFLARTLGSGRVLLVCAYRDVDPVPGSALVETLAEVAREPVTGRLQLGPLSEADVAEYVALTASELASPGLVAALHAETDGNPLFVGETVRLLAVEGVPSELRIAVPQSVRDVVQRRISHLSTDCGSMLSRASVLGREFELASLSRLCELSEDALLDLLDEAMAARVVSEVPGADGRLRFAHMVIRDTLYRQLTSVRRVRLHRRALEALEAAHGDARVSELAHHAAAGHDFGKSLHYARRAGDRALALLAYEEAARMYRRALDAIRDGDSEELRCELLLSLGHVEIRAGDLPAGKQAFLEAASIARRLGLARQLARAAYGYGGRNVFARAGSDHLITTLLEQALATLGNEDGELRILLLSRLAGALRDEHSRDRRDRLSREAVELARHAGSPEALAYALTARTAARLAPDTIEECIVRGHEMEEVATRSGDLEQIAAAHTHQVFAQVVVGDIDGAERRVAAAMRTALELKQPARIWLASAQSNGLKLLAGRLDGLDEAIENTHADGERATPEMAVPAYHLQRYALHELRGTVADAEPGIARMAAERPWSPSFLCVLASIHVRTGRSREAQQELTALVRDDCAALPFDAAWLFAMSLLAETCARLNDHATAPVLYRLLLPYAELHAADFPEGIRGAMARYLGLLAMTLGRLDDAAQHLEAAEAMNERMRARPWLAYTRHDHGRVLHARNRPGDRERARRLINAALAAYSELGMTTPWAPPDELAAKTAPASPD